MATLTEVKNRIKSIKNITQITRALEAVSASRVRKAQARVLASRAFAGKAWEILVNLQNSSKGTPLHPLLTSREEIKCVMVVLITSERGLAGAYNTNILRVADQFEQRLGKPVKYVGVGSKARDHLVRSGAEIVAEFSGMPPEPTISDIAPIARLAVDAFLSGEVDEVLVAYTDFVSMLSQRPTVLGWLPLTTDSVANQVASEYVKDVPAVTGASGVYEYEPDAKAVVEELVPRFTELQLYQALLEALASEHAARMAAMRNASDNASQLTEDLTLEYNKARQTAITGEILDIVGGAQALQQAMDAAAKSIERAMANEDIGAKVAMTGASAVAMGATAGAKANTPPSPPPPAPAKPAPPKSSNGSSGKKKAEVVGQFRDKKVKQDDLTIVDGIGPKMSKALHASGISTWQKLSETANDTLREAIEAHGMKFSPSLDTWAEQAAYAAKHDFDGLEKFQDSLIGGRRPS